VIEYIRKYKTIVTVFGLAFVVAVVVLVVNGGDDAEDPVALDTTTPPVATSTTDGATQPDSQVPAIDCAPLLTAEETGGALAAFDRPEGQGGSFEISQSEVCTESLAVDESYFVRIEPGNPDDFEPGATLNGTTGENVGHVGDGALWFGGAEAEGSGAVGLLTVREETPLGALHFHIVLGRPDIDETAQREIVIELARLALPRFPGVEIEPPEPEVIIFEEETPDRSDISLTDNVLAKEEAGEWTLGEGLVAMLSLIADETERSSVLGQTELVDPSASDVIRLGEDYLETGPDGLAKDEIARLLDMLTFAPEELDQMSAGEPLTPHASTLLVSLQPVAQEGQSQGCDKLELPNPCLVKVPVPDRDGVPPNKHKMYASLIEGSAWDQIDVDLAVDALLDSAEKYEVLGDMPATTLVLLPGGDELFVHFIRNDCAVYVDDFLAGTDPLEFQQIVAREIAFCLIGQTYFSILTGNQGAARWWTHGLANYLSGVIYDDVNLEHKNLPAKLAQVELSTTLADRSFTNWVLFEYLHGVMGAGAIMEMIAAFPPGGDHIAALANYGGMSELYHDFERGLSDANIGDIGGGTVPYDPIAWELPLSGPTEVPFPVPRFGVRRLHIIVPSGQYACFETTENGEQRVSWRPGEPGQAGSWSDELPISFEGENVMMITTLEQGVQFKMTVTDVDDDPDCQDEEESSTPPADECELNVVCRASRYFFSLLGD
jgi:hypothetical protein